MHYAVKVFLLYSTFEHIDRVRISNRWFCKVLGCLSKGRDTIFLQMVFVRVSLTTMEDYGEDFFHIARSNTLAVFKSTHDKVLISFLFYTRPVYSFIF